ncbi:MAG: hypothetical protein D6791_03805 [Chloroflexi bacterium]|nr:MAG: hypothetical protein D6791_03805 [Chloroflexota bacterium]
MTIRPFRVRHETGATIVDYALILGLIAAAAIGGLIAVGGGLDVSLAAIGDNLADAPAEVADTVEQYFDQNDLDWDFIWGKWKQNKKGWMYSKQKWAKAVARLTGSDYEFSLDLQTTRTGKDIWDVSRVIFRFQDPKNYYALVPKKDGSLELAKMQNGKWIPWLKNVYTGANPKKPHNFKVRVVGNNIQVWQDGRYIFDYTDPNPIPTGNVGVTNDDSRGRFSNLQVTVYNPADNASGGNDRGRKRDGGERDDD